MPDLEAKKEWILTRLQTYDALAVAFSGGVDSSLLLALAKAALGGRVVALTARSPVHPTWETEAARKFATELGVRHVVFDSGEMAMDDFRANSPDRCYICKKRLFADLKAEAGRLGIAAVSHGANHDDLGDFRPGMAAAAEMDIVAPLLDAGLSKAHVRAMSKGMGLSTWDRPAMACLATRIPYGTPITARALAMVAEAEAVLRARGFAHCRVRHYGDVAKIELSLDDLVGLASLADRQGMIRAFKQIGFVHVAVDLEGYRPGSMNAALKGGDHG